MDIISHKFTGYTRTEKLKVFEFNFVILENFGQITAVYCYCGVKINKPHEYSNTHFSIIDVFTKSVLWIAPILPFISDSSARVFLDLTTDPIIINKIVSTVYH